MATTQIAFLGLLFVAVSAGAFFVMSLFSRSPTADRLSALGAGKAAAPAGADA
jgi:tight adherence protein C